MAKEPDKVEQLKAAYPGHELGVLDVVIWGVALAAFFLFPSYLSLGTTVLIMILFALSLNMAVGFGGIETLGHAAFFGTGAYGAALYALHVSEEPLSGLLVAGAAAGMIGIVSGVMILRTRGLTLIMLTLAIASMLHEFATTAKAITGGDDGLGGYKISPVLGVFRFDMFGQTGYLYCLAVLALAFIFCRIVANSPFGLTAHGIRENPLRMRLLGIPVNRRLVGLYAFSAVLAGVAGGLSAQVTRIVSVDSLGFIMSGNVLIMLVLGGVGRLYGAFLGAAVYVVFSDRAAAIDPYNWLLAIGVLLILVVRYMPDGLIGFVESTLARLSGAKR
jgi:branched-chain amino acid transport system permease protein